MVDPNVPTELVGQTFCAVKPGRYFQSHGPAFLRPSTPIKAVSALSYEVEVVWVDDAEVCVNSITRTATGHVRQVNRVCRLQTLLNEINGGHLMQLQPSATLASAEL